MAAVGLFVMRIAIARRLVRLRWVTIAWASSAGGRARLDPDLRRRGDGEVRAAFGLRPGNADPVDARLDVREGLPHAGALPPPVRLCGAMAIWLDRPERPRRSTGALLALAGAYLAAGAAILAPAVTGHAGQTSPRGLAIPVDWIHIAAGAVWIGGLIGLLVIAATHRAPASSRSSRASRTWPSSPSWR